MTNSIGGRPCNRREAMRLSAVAASTSLLVAGGEASAGDAGTQDNAGMEVKPRPEDVGSMEAIVKALYDTISGPAGPRDWNRLRSLFLPGARMIPSGRRPDGSTAARVLSVEDFIKA